MSTTQKKLANPSQLGISVDTYYQVPVGTRTTLTNVILQNTTTTPVEVTIHLVPSGGSASDTNEVFRQKIPGLYPRSVYELINATLSAGDTLQALADTATAVTLHLSGKEEV